jgi:hypothetical protein
MTTTRREFIFTSVKGIIALSALPLLSSCGNAARDISKDPEASKLADVIGKDRAEILYLASLAPSGHNSQPWKVQIENPDKWVLSLDESRLLPAVDPAGRESLLSLGAFLENLSSAALNFGYAAKYEITEGSNLFATKIDISLSKAEPIKFDVSKIKMRRTIRTGFLNTLLSADDLNFITGGSKNFIYYSPASREGKYLAEGTVEANILQAGRADAVKELSEWIRFSNSGAEKYKDGLTPASMDINGIAGLFVRMFYDKESVMSDSFKEKTIAMAKDQCSSLGGWIALTSSGSSARQLVEAGRLFERACLRIRERNIALHPMSQMLEEDKFKHDVAKTLGIHGQVQFILRAGYVKEYTEPVTLRRPVDWFAVSA